MTTARFAELIAFSTNLGSEFIKDVTVGDAFVDVARPALERLPCCLHSKLLLVLEQISPSTLEIGGEIVDTPLRREFSIRNGLAELARSHTIAFAVLWLRSLIHADTMVGMAFSNIVAFFIILTATLHAHGITNISTSPQAASALEPIAGRFAGILFVCGTVGTGLLAVPVLGASAAYGIGEGCRARTSRRRICPWARPAPHQRSIS